MMCINVLQWQYRIETSASIIVFLHSIFTIIFFREYLEMRVEFEFYDEEPLENIITCLNYQMDKVVFFKYKNQSQMPPNNRIMKEKSEREQRQKDNLKKYLIDKCEVKEVRFVDLNRNSLKDAVEVMH